MLLAFSSLFAQEGHTFPIEEQATPTAMLGDPHVIPNQEETKREILNQIQAPHPVKGLQEAKEYAAYFFDPSYVVQEDITDLQGNKIASKGQMVNPLHHTDALQDLIFFDGTNSEHIHLTKTYVDAKWILVKGNPLQLEEETGHAIFFDQGGAICKHFGLTRIPAKLSKSKDRLLIEEIPANKGGM